MLLLATLDDKIDHIRAFAATPTTTAIVNRVLLLAVSFLTDILPFPIAEYDYVLRQCFLLVAFNINVILIATRFYTLRFPHSNRLLGFLCIHIPRRCQRFYFGNLVSTRQTDMNERMNGRKILRIFF